MKKLENILAENMRRFGTKNLNEDDDQNNNGYPDTSELPSDWKRSAEELMNVGEDGYDGYTFDDVIEDIYRAIGYGVEDEDELIDWVRKHDVNGEYKYIYED
jgi:hypothetical protein